MTKIEFSLPYRPTIQQIAFYYLEHFIEHKNYDDTSIMILVDEEEHYIPRELNKLVLQITKNINYEYDEFIYQFLVDSLDVFASMRDDKDIEDMRLIPSFDAPRFRKWFYINKNADKFCNMAINNGENEEIGAILFVGYYLQANDIFDQVRNHLVEQHLKLNAI